VGGRRIEPEEFLASLRLTRSFTRSFTRKKKLPAKSEENVEHPAPRYATML
jgi:hypothetical protein